MKLIISLIAIFCLHFSTCTRTEEQTVEADGTIKTVITEEWVEETHKTHEGHGHGRGRGDTIIIMTNDNENTDHHDSHIDKTGILDRFYNEKRADHDYSIDKTEKESIQQKGFKFDTNIGRIILKREEFPECTDLVPITRMAHEGCTGHGLVVHSANVRRWITKLNTWTNTGIIGYGVLEQGKCGATRHVQHAAKHSAVNCKLNIQIQTGSETEYDTLLKLGYVPGSALKFYLWDENDHFSATPHHPHTDKTAQVNRIYNYKKDDYDYVIDREVEAILTQAVHGYKFDTKMGRIVAKPTDFPECKDLVPITKMTHDACTSHGIVVNSTTVNQWKTVHKFKDSGVIGYGVLTKGRCGANLQVRHLGISKSSGWPAGCKVQFQTTSDVEYNDYKKPIGYFDGVAPSFYIWE